MVGVTRAGVTLKLYPQNIYSNTNIYKNTNKKINKQNRLSLMTYIPNGGLFSVPFNSVRIPPPAKGDVVTFSYEVHARRELPTNPEITRKRTDLSWEEVVESSQNEVKVLNGMKKKKQKNTRYI